MSSIEVGDRVVIARLFVSHHLNGIKGIVERVGLNCDSGGSEGLFEIFTADNRVYKCERENLDLLQKNARAPSMRLLSSLLADSHNGSPTVIDEVMMRSRMRVFFSWQILIGWVGLGGVAGWCLEAAFARVYDWCARDTGSWGTFFYTLVACWLINSLEGQVIGLTPQIKRWVESDGERMLLPSPLETVPRVAAFAAFVACFGNSPHGTLLMLLLHALYHARGALCDFDDFVRKCEDTSERRQGLSSACEWEPRQEESKELEDANQAIYEGGCPYARLGLAVGLTLHAALPLSWIAFPSVVVVALSLVSRLLSGLPALLAGCAVLVGLYAVSASLVPAQAVAG